VAAEELAMQDPGSLVERWFSNVNTPEDMEAIKGTLGIE
jgi:molybdopterin-guanine dinucleotide biosynthesis protein A